MFQRRDRLPLNTLFQPKAVKGSTFNMLHSSVVFREYIIRRHVFIKHANYATKFSSWEREEEAQKVL